MLESESEAAIVRLAIEYWMLSRLSCAVAASKRFQIGSRQQMVFSMPVGWRWIISTSGVSCGEKGRAGIFVSDA